jgi:glycine betaine/choline ABC-type transport system substrate-binding protein
MWTTMTMTGGVDGASLKIGAKSFTEEALLAAITKIELGNPGIDF